MQRQAVRFEFVLGIPVGFVRGLCGAELTIPVLTKEGAHKLSERGKVERLWGHQHAQQIIALVEESDLPDDIAALQENERIAAHREIALLQVEKDASLPWAFEIKRCGEQICGAPPIYTVAQAILVCDLLVRAGQLEVAQAYWVIRECLRHGLTEQAHFGMVARFPGALDISTPRDLRDEDELMSELLYGCASRLGLLHQPEEDPPDTFGGGGTTIALFESDGSYVQVTGFAAELLLILGYTR